MKKNRKLFIFAFFIVSLSVVAQTQSVFAAGESSTETTVKAQPSVLEATEKVEPGKRLLDRFSVNLQNVLAGPPVGRPMASIRPDNESESGEGTLDTENTLYAGYKISQFVSVGPTMVFHWHPVSDHEFKLSDPYARISHSQLLKQGDFTLAADFRMSAPVSNESRKNELITSIASEQTSTLGVGRTNFVLALTTFLQKNFHKPGDGDVNDFEFHLKPAIGYRLRQNLLANVVYERKMAHKRDQDLTQVHNKGNVVQPGIAWDITENMNFNPYFDIPIDRPITADSATFGAQLNWQLL